MNKNINEYNNSRIKKYKNRKKILISGGNWVGMGMPHFVHTMEYFYYASDIILKYENDLIILIEPPVNYYSDYVFGYIEKFFKLQDNVILINQHYINKFEYYKRYVFNHFSGVIGVGEQDGLRLIGNFLINEKIKPNYYYNWFQYKNSNKLRDLFFPEIHHNSNKKIGMINRKCVSKRVILNADELINSIEKKFSTHVDLINFENINFETQAQFFNEHDIIITPHGGQLVSTPFCPNGALIIECVHEEWHPYYYFPGLSHTCDKFHAMVCDNHDCFPTWFSKEHDNNYKQQKLNIDVNIEKILYIMEKYFSNKMNSKFCNLL